MNQAFYLSSLQKIDRRLDQISHRLAEIKRTLESDTTVATAKADLDSALKLIEKQKTKLKEAEFRDQQVRIKINQSESALYGGKVRNPKELQDLEKEISLLKKQLATLEDEVLNSMLSVEEAEEKASTCQKTYQAAVTKFSSQQSILLGEKDTLIKEQAKYQMERQAAVSPISPEQLSQYERLRRSKGGIAVANVEDEACSICGASITPADIQSSRSPHLVVFCSSCGRIIFGG